MGDKFNGKFMLIVGVWYDKIVSEKDIHKKLEKLKKFIDILNEIYHNYKISHPEMNRSDDK